MKRRSSIPLATYRLQLNRDFTFAQATAIVPYLSALGVSHCYISPCLKARPGSMHGYDIVDHNSLNPEIGTREEFDGFVSALHQHGMGLILDIVPNHMAVMGSDNAWWLDVLENGEASVYACFFDIDWHPLKDELHGKVLVPVLHDHYGAVLESGELKLTFHPERGEFDISYRNHRFPVNPREYPRILERGASNLAAKLGEQNPALLELQSLTTAFGHLPARHEASSERVVERNRDKEINKRRLAELCARSPEIAEGVRTAADLINGTPADPSTFDELHELIKAQAFRLANWRVASDDINYRRFFDTNDLAGICMENESVFQATHRLILELVAEGKVDGLRIDHPDGLYDPAQYFERLKQSIADSVKKAESSGNSSHYVVIEKILTGTERLPAEWPVCGTTGYDFANLVNGLFVDPAAAARLDGIYRRFVDDEADFDDLAYRSRKLIVRVALASELNVLANQITRIALSKRKTCDFTLNNLRDALTEVVASFPVYRTYVSPSSVSEDDARYIRRAVALAKQRSPAADTSVFDFIGEVLPTRIAEGQDTAYRKAVTTFAMKFQQFTSPVMAKGLEDTAFYRHNRLVSLNEVGSDPQRFGTTVSEFHAANRQRFRDWPNTMLASSTHDSKRSEDVRARINVLSEISPMWGLRVREWRRFNRSHKNAINGVAAPSPNDEYLVYQTLVGAWPSEPLNDQNDWKAFCGRIENYVLKAIREAKENTSWINQNVEYEGAVTSFVRALLNPAADNRFLKDFLPFQRRIARIGLWNSLSQTLLKLTCPGVPDIYQGNELWDFSLVDPDNRRPVDYVSRRRIFEGLKRWGDAPDKASIDCLMKTPEDGRIKAYLVWRTLCLRQQQVDLFQKGEYLPLAVAGAKAGHVIAFDRRFEGTSVIVIAPRLISGLLNDPERPPLGPQIWEDTHVLLPTIRSGKQSQNAFTGKVVDFESRVNVSSILADFPVALCLLS
ncbi:MAG TPA: malto-oligosyltrehalose synthase [Candidatus Acidoferrum sp.]|jgi:(1->4)-alpha-D-glucan 1-alpha-D-glucosylmutase|nr:malto-oligosyltrehalose synthase [Candidatus Acidoferrum sp.]